MSAIEIKNLKKHFGKVRAVDGISFEVEKGEVFGYLGPNGAGKTTTIRCMMDYIHPTSGSIKILGKDAHKDGVELKKRIGSISGEFHLYDKWTGQQHLDFVQKLNGKDPDVMELVELLDYDLSKKAKTLSSGNRRKLGVIMAFMQKPELLILDELTLALDPLLQNKIYDLIEKAKERGATIFFSSHNLPEVERVCNRVAVIRQGKLVATESIKTLKSKRLYSVHATFKDKVGEEEFNLKDAEIVKAHGHELELRVKGDINPLIAQLQKHDLKDLNISHASLEDIFLEYYEL